MLTQSCHFLFLVSCSGFLQRTKDGRVIIIHDDTVDRTTTCKGSVTTLTQADLASCSLTNGEPIRLLSELLPSSEQGHSNANSTSCRRRGLSSPIHEGMTLNVVLKVAVYYCGLQTGAGRRGCSPGPTLPSTTP